MVSIDTFRKLALSFPGVSETPHFEKTSFRFGTKIFATLDIKNQLACLMLSVPDQSVFSLFDKITIYPVPNKWGLKGATYFELKTVRKDMLADAMQLAYDRIPKKKFG